MKQSSYCIVQFFQIFPFCFRHLFHYHQELGLPWLLLGGEEDDLQKKNKDEQPTWYWIMQKLH